MKKFEKGKRFLTFLLVALMVVQQSSVTTLAEELAEYTQEAQNQDTEAVAEVSEASEPEASVPDSDKAQEQQPAAEEPAAPAEQETAEVTEAPQATEAPAQETAPTEAPAQEAEQTEAPQENAAVTETPQATEAPVVTEAPAETATKAQFSGAVDNATANVTLSQPISDKAVFVAKQYSVDSDYFANNAEAAVSQWVANNGLTVLDATAYDMHFEENGQEIAVNQSANVSLSFNSPILTMTGDAGVPSNIYVLHIVNGQAVAAGSASQDGNGAVVAANITTEGFSPFVFVKAVSGDAVAPADDQTPIDLATAIKSISLAKVTYTNKSGQMVTEAFDSNKKYPRNAKLDFRLEYAFAESNKPSADGVKSATYQLPAGITFDNTNMPKNLTDPTYTAGIPGTYTIKDGVITFYYEEEYLKYHKNSIAGTLEFGGSLDESSLENEDSITITFPGSGEGNTITIQFEEGNVKGEKSYTFNDDGTITFTIKLNVTGKDVTNVNLTDTMGSNLEFASDPEFKLDGNAVSGNISISGGVANLQLGNLTVGEHILTYKARLKSSETTSGDTNKNAATWTWNENGSGNADTTVSVKKREIKKSGWYDATNNVINWTIYYTPGQLDSAAGKKIKDTLSGKHKYTGNYKVYYDKNRTDMNWVSDNTLIAQGSLDGEATSFEYTFPESCTDLGGVYKIVYQTELTEDISNVPDGGLKLTNKAEDDKTSTGDTSVTVNKPSGPSEPSENIVQKSGTSNSEDRTAEWTITVTPPTGKTVTDLVVTDTLKDFWNWQGKFLKDTLEIKEGNTTLEKGTDYTIQITPGSKSPYREAVMVITFSKNITDVVTIKYKSDYNDSKDTQFAGWSGNSANISYKIDGNDKTGKADASVEIKKTDFDLNKNGKLVGDTAEWEIVINKLQAWERTELPDLSDQISDVLPAGMEYVEGSATYKIFPENVNGDTKAQAVSVTPSYDESTRTLHFSIPGLKGKVRAVINYKTKIVSIPEASGDGVTVDGDKITFENKATVGKKTTTGKVEMTSRELSKTGKQVEGRDNIVEYTIHINWHGKDLLDNEDTLTLEDLLDADLILDTTSIKVKDTDTNEDITFGSSFSTTDDGRTKMVLTIPDEKHLVVTYRATLSSVGKTDGTTYQVSNEASLKGEVGKKSSTETDVKYK